MNKELQPLRIGHISTKSPDYLDLNQVAFRVAQAAIGAAEKPATQPKPFRGMGLARLAREGR